MARSPHRPGHFVRRDARKRPIARRRGLVELKGVVTAAVPDATVQNGRAFNRPRAQGVGLCSSLWRNATRPTERPHRDAGRVIASGRTQRSKSSGLTTSIAASRSVVPSTWARLAILAAAS